MTGETDFHAIRPDLCLAVSGAPGGRAHFRREYGEPGAASGPPDIRLTVDFARARGPASVAGGHKTVGWHVRLGDANAEVLDAEILIRGRPRSFALSLVQGYFAEPLLSIAAARAGYVLLPSAAFEQSGGAVVVLGRSGSGKSSLSARALAGGGAVFGDDQVLIDAAGRCFRFPRRMRFYSDLAVTAPTAHARLGRPERAALLARGLAKRATGGWVAPSLAVPAERLGRPAAGPAAIRRLVLIERDDTADDLAVHDLTLDRVLDDARDVLAEQRAHLGRAGSLGWTEALESTSAREGELLRRALEPIPLERLAVPRGWDASRALSALAERLLVP